MNTTREVVRTLARVRQAVDHWAGRGAEDETVLQLRLWRLQQARLTRHSLALVHARADAHRLG